MPPSQSSSAWLQTGQAKKAHLAHPNPGRTGHCGILNPPAQLPGILMLRARFVHQMHFATPLSWYVDEKGKEAEMLPFVHF